MRWILSISIAIVVLGGCIYYMVNAGHSGYDPELQTPDIDAGGLQHGDRLTPLGCLLYTPLSYNDDNYFYNIATYRNGKEVRSVGRPCSDLQKQVVFEFHRDGTLAYWFKKDYLKSPTDTITYSGGGISTTHTILPSSELHLKNIYRSGKWVADFKDSTLTIDFGTNDFGLVPFVGRYTTLGAGRLVLCQTIDFDSVINGKVERFIKKINTYYRSY